MLSKRGFFRGWSRSLLEERCKINKAAKPKRPNHFTLLRHPARFVQDTFGLAVLSTHDIINLDEIRVLEVYCADY